MNLLYTFGIYIFRALIGLAAWINPKAKQWIKDREGLLTQLQNELKTPVDIWMHCASLGEFEQGRPLLEAIRQQYPEKRLLLTFFSPSGYEIRKNYAQVDYVCYLPMDTPRKVQRFLDITQPKVAIFVKYEFWQNYLYALQKRETPTLLISAIFHPAQPFFRWYAPLFRPVLDCFTQIFVQNQTSARLLESISHKDFQIAGDTRVDRVVSIAKSAKQFPLIEQFIGDAPILIAGSTWPADEAILADYIQKNEAKYWKYIIAPHDISEAHIQHILARFDILPLRYTQLQNNINLVNAKVLVVDTIGMLSQLYQYGKLAYIGGGFGAGIHNTLEPIAFGLPVLFGPKYEKFEEAVQLVNSGGGFVIQDEKTFQTTFETLQIEKERKKAVQAATAYIETNQGATRQILDYLYTLLH